MDTRLAPDRPTNTVAAVHIPTNRYVAFASIALVGCAIDLLTKHLVFSAPDLRAGAIWWQWPQHIGIQLSLNEGALFGIGQGGVWLFAGLGILAAMAIPAWLFVFKAARDGWMTCALGCVMAGVVGNLYDRLGLHGEKWSATGPRAGQAAHAVRDWILWQVNDHWRWPNFNIADSLLVTGACLLFLHALWLPRCQND